MRPTVTCLNRTHSRLGSDYPFNEMPYPCYFQAKGIFLKRRNLCDGYFKSEEAVEVISAFSLTLNFKRNLLIESPVMEFFLVL